MCSVVCVCVCVCVSSVCVCLCVCSVCVCVCVPACEAGALCLTKVLRNRTRGTFCAAKKVCVGGGGGGCVGGLCVTSADSSRTYFVSCDCKVCVCVCVGGWVGVVPHKC